MLSFEKRLFSQGNSMKLKAFTLLAAALFAGNAFATPVSALNLNAVGAGTFNYSGSLGWYFSVNSNTVVSSLGQWDNADNGLQSNSYVGIWNASNQLLTSATIVAGTGTLHDHYRYADIADIVLTPGQVYAISATFYGPVAISNYAGYSMTPDAHVNVIASGWNGSGNMPLNSMGSPSIAYLGPNFEIGSNDVPEPGSLALLGLGIAGFAAVRRRKAV
jgi:hypothetical protein